VQRKHLKTLSTIGFLIVMVIVGAWYVHGHLEAFKKILEIDLRSFVELSLLSLVAIWVSGQQVNVLTVIFDTRLGQWEAFGLSAANTMANFYFTKAGMAAKGLYLKRRHAFPYTLFVSTLAGAYVISLVTFGVMGVVAYLVFTHGSGVRLDVMAVFFALIGGGLLPLALPMVRGKLDRFLPQRAQRVIEGWETVRSHRKQLFVLALLNAFYVAIGGVRLYVAYRALGNDVALLPCIVISTLSTITVIFTLTPGGMGIRQALVGYGSDALHIGAAQGVVASTIDHAVGTLWVFIIGVAFTNWLWMRGIRGGGEDAGGNADEGDAGGEARG